MKTFKTFLYAVVVAASLAFYATDAKAGIGIVTNYDTVALSVTIITNGLLEPINGGYKASIGEMKLVTKDFLNLLTNSDFAGTNFPAGAKMVLGWDTNWDGDVLVVDKTGTNVLYDATSNNGNKTNATISIYPFGTGIQRFIWKESGSYTLTEQHTGNFFFIDRGSQMQIFANANGPCTDHFSWKVISSDNTDLWSDSQDFTLYGFYSESFTPWYPPLLIPPVFGTVNGSIKLSGHGEGYPGFLFIFTSVPVP